jgi:hypothetical protein
MFEGLSLSLQGWRLLLELNFLLMGLRKKGVFEGKNKIPTVNFFQIFFIKIFGLDPVPYWT